MRMTLIDPRATATATLDAPEQSSAPRESWQDPFAYGYEEIEAPWAFRYAQIGIGIATYFIVSRWVGPILMLPLLGAVDDMEPETGAVGTALVTLALYCLGALAGGAAAGAWARNWVPQGLGVAAGVLFIPIVLMLVFAPEHWFLFFIALLVTSGLTIVGAYVGHLVVKPTRIPKS